MEYLLLFGVPILTMLCISVLAYRYVNQKYKDFYIISFLLGIICMFMCTKFFPWKFMPQLLTKIQFPWRLVGLAMFFLSPIMAINVCELINLISKEKIRIIVYILVILVIGIFTQYKLQNYKLMVAGTNELTDREYESRTIKNPVLSQWRINREYLPYKAYTKINQYLNERKDKVYLIKGEITIKNEQKEGLHLSFDIENSKKAVLELPYLFYPGYTAEIADGTNTQLLKITESDNGFLQIEIPENFKNGTITVKYTGTILEKTSYVVSLISIVIFIIYIVYSKKRKNYEREN